MGSILTRGDTVIARGRNLVSSNGDPTAHAETVALRAAAQALGQVEFVGSTLYTTLEPCPLDPRLRGDDG